MLAPRALRAVLCVLSCAWLHADAASRLKSPALPIQSEREPLPSKGLSGKQRKYTITSHRHPFKYMTIYLVFGGEL